MKNFRGTKSLKNILGGLKSNVDIFMGTILHPPLGMNFHQGLVFRGLVLFKVLKLTVNCLPLISFESKISKKYKFLNLRGILHTSAKLQGDICA